jgi:hypothetical protein
MLTQQEIREGIEANMQILQEAKERILEIRDQCKHPNTFIGIWEWSPGHILEKATICSDCLGLVKPSVISKHEGEVVKQVKTKS